MTRSARLFLKIEKSLNQSALHKETGVTQGEMAEMLGTSRNTVNCVIHGKQMIGPAVALKIEEKFGIKAETIMKNSALDFLDRYRKSLKDS